MLAAMRGNAAMARLLVDRGASASRVDTYGKTAAAYAGEEGYQELAGLLSQRLK
jgi:ankyrin repeat protein